MDSPVYASPSFIVVKMHSKLELHCCVQREVVISYPIQMHINTNLMDAFSPCYLPSHHIFLFLSWYHKPAALWLVTHRSAKMRIHAVCACAVLDEPCGLPFGIVPSCLEVSGIRCKEQEKINTLVGSPECCISGFPEHGGRLGDSTCAWHTSRQSL